mmetsp:Transcript_24058/g.27746  ORF Transcript_24058/g.27746 Transcript_24058/m.27746 type:complete len:126 (+) Transcript_24058:204-581(+)
MKASRRRDTRRANKEKPAPFIYCMSCFRTGKEERGHKNSHSYMFLDKLSYPVFEQDDWTLMDELEFLKGIDQCGIDNWQTLSTELKNTKSIEELFTHFYSFYYNPFEMVNRIDKLNKVFTLNENK